MNARVTILTCAALLASAGVLLSDPIELPLVAAAADQGKPQATVAVSAFRFTGNTVYTGEELGALLQSAKTNGQTLPQLRELAGTVEAHYRNHGYTNVRVVVPEQEIAGGVVTFQVVEPKVGTVSVNGNRKYSEAFLRKQLRGVESGAVLRSADLERSLLLLNENPGLKAKASLQAGPTPGTTDVVVSVEEEARFVTGSTELNTFGSRYASRERIAQSVSFGNVSGRGDSLSLGVVTAPSPSDLLFGQLRYDVPLGSNGTRLNLYGLAGDYEVGQEFAVLGMQGNGRSFGVSVVQPRIKTRNRSLLWELGIDLKNSELELLGQRSSYDKIRSARLGFALDELGPGSNARNMASVYVHQGLGETLGGMADSDPFTSRLGADNSFTKVAVDLARVQQLDQRSYLIARLGAQLTDSPLVAGEQFDVGGADSVRGYPQSELLGDNGLRASLEWRYTPKLGSRPGWLEDFQTALFLDHGRIANKNPIPGQPKAESVTGVGIGFRADLADGFFLRADLGYALSEEPSRGGKLQPYFQAIRRY
jgi:hemolysin activation/secretion protein